MITIATAPRNDVDLSAGVAPILGRKVRGLNFDLLDKVDADVIDLAVVAARVHIETAVD